MNMMTTLEAPSSELGLVTDWVSLGALLHVRSYVLTYILHRGKELRHRINLGKRVVYKSGPALQIVQTRLGMVFKNIMEGMEGNEDAIAYRPGIAPATIIRELTDYDTLITTDIRGYFDHIHMRHIETALTDCGMHRLGARLMARYCLWGKGLQQGSPASPALSNIVGVYYFDRPIREWLQKQYPDVEVRYVRYCDNIALFVKNAPSEDFVREYKLFVKNHTKRQGFSTHAWSTVNKTHPKRRQAFLGIVLNHNARVERRSIDRLRALFFTRCTHGSAVLAERLMVLNGGHKEEDAHEFVNNLGSEMVQKKVESTLKGHISYVKTVNDRHAMWLQKLFEAGSVLDNCDNRPLHYTEEGAELRKVLFPYKRDEETQEQFINNVLEFLGIPE